MTSLALLATLAVAQSPVDDDSSQAAAKRLQQEMAAYEIRVDAPGDDRLGLRPEPILHWNNPARRGEDGAMFAWTRGGRPEVIGTAFTFIVGDRLGRAHEFHSLADGPLEAATDGTTTWTPRKPGVVFRPVPAAPKPARTDAGRLVQMRSLARDYDAELFDNQDVPTQLRLVSQPLIRYASPENGVTDGAVFAFAISTDPELLLVLEARGRGAKAAWHVAFARFHFHRLRVTRDGDEVWQAESRPELNTTRFGDGIGVDEPYIIYRFDYTTVEEPAATGTNE